MLYDNAPLASALPARLAGLRRPGVPAHLEETTRLRAARDETVPSRVFYSAQDADSEGTRGKFSSGRRTRSTRPGAEADAAMAYWGSTAASTSLGRLSSSAARRAVEPERVLCPPWRRTLFEERELRVKPGRDDSAWRRLERAQARVRSADCGDALVEASAINLAARPAAQRRSSA